MIKISQYNPFDKHVSKLDEIDLNKLIDEKVAEGWYIEYKSTFPSSNKKIGHSIASFANTDGGWYIIGVDDDDDTNIANDICGFELETHSQPKEKIANIIKTHIKPIPFFESKLIKLNNDKGVLVVYIDKGMESPYITLNGKIYQRIGEVSDPKPVTDPNIYQRLFERSKYTNRKIESFTKNSFVMSKKQAKEKICFLETYVYLKSSNFYFKDFHTEEFFDKLKTNFSEQVELFDDTEINVESPFEVIYSSTSSIILRNLNISINSIDLLITIEIFRNGNFKFLMPVPNLILDDEWNDDIIDEYTYRTIFEKFYNLLSDDERSVLKIIDAQAFSITFLLVFNQYLKLIKSCDYNGQIGIRFFIDNCWRNVLFFNSEEYIELIQENGVPIIQKSNIQIPTFINGKMINRDIENKNIALSLLVNIFESFGLPMSKQMVWVPALTNFIHNKSEQ